MPIDYGKLLRVHDFIAQVFKERRIPDFDATKNVLVTLRLYWESCHICADSTEISRFSIETYIDKQLNILALLINVFYLFYYFVNTSVKHDISFELNIWHKIRWTTRLVPDFRNMKLILRNFDTLIAELSNIEWFYVVDNWNEQMINDAISWRFKQVKIYSIFLPFFLKMRQVIWMKAPLMDEH